MLNPLYDVAGLTRTETPEDLEVVTRSGAVGRFRVLINHASRPVPVPAAGSVDAVSGNPVVEGTTVPAGGVLVLREEDDAEHER